ncbi:MAG: hypothetical protein WC314_19125 [Vulcanimicrobiota bacterium]
MRFRIFLLAGFLLLSALVSAQPQTPVVYLNEKVRLVELARSQRATLRYDLRPIQGEHLTVKLYHHEQNLSGEPVREWIFHSPASSERISFKDLPLAVYAMVCYASDESGQPLAYASPVIHVEYGGWRAWEKFQPPIETVEGTPEGFEDLSVATNVSNQDVSIGVDPPAVVIRPGQTVEFRPAFRNMESEPLEWKLVGDGKLEAKEPELYLYTAPSDQLGTKLFRIEVQSPAHPDLKGIATILVTTQTFPSQDS